MRESEALTWLANALTGLPLEVLVQPAGSRGDVLLRAGGHDYRFDLKAAPGPWPSSVNQAANAKGFSPEHLVLYAETFSPGAVDVLSSRGINWVDSHGNVRLTQWPALVIEKLRSQPPMRPRDFAWTRSAEDLAEHILANPARDLTIVELAQQLGWSPGQLSKTLSGFDKLGWTVRHGSKRGSGAWRTPSDTLGVMLESWASHVAGQALPTRTLHAISRDMTSRVISALREADISGSWALTGLAAANLYAPLATSVGTVEVALEDRQFDSNAFWALMEQQGNRISGAGGAIRMVRVESRVLGRGEVRDGTPVVSAPRVYAGLKAGGGRASEIADGLREVAIGV